MNTVMLVLTPLLPLLLAPWLRDTAQRRWLPLAALPALATALWLPTGSQLTLPWLLLGVHLHLDAAAQLLMLLSALIWLLAAISVAASAEQTRAQVRGQTPGRRGFMPSFLLAMAGNFIVLLAADAVTFYLGFALMGLSAYGMLVNPRSQRARRAARVYLTFTLLGEVALFAGIVLLVAATGSTLFSDLSGQTLPGAAVALLLLGFGIKVALPGLHLWLPLTYTLAPLTAVAVLSGPMMKAGLLGWIRFLPADAVGVAAWGDTLIVLGGLGVALGVLLGIVQREPRAVLAYSSVAKMGLMSAIFGVAISDAAHGTTIVAALLLLAAHHLLVKSSLFLGIGATARQAGQRWILLPFGLLALSLAGAPLMAGHAAKLAIGDALGGRLAVLLTLSAIGTALLMARFMFLLSRRVGVEAGRGNPVATGAPAKPWLTPVWLVWVPVASIAPFVPDQLGFDVAALQTLGIGLLLAALAWVATMRWPRLRLRPPARDGLQILASLAHRAWPTSLRVPKLHWPTTLTRLASAPQAQPAPAATTGVSLVGAGLRWLSVFLLLLLAVLSPL